MKLKIKDAAELLQVSERMIYRWIDEGTLPFHQADGQYRFNRAELLEWATARHLPISPRIISEPEDVAVPTLERSLRSGGIHYQVKGNDRATVLRGVVDILALPEDMDRDFLFQVLLARERLGSTAVGEGVAIPHVRNPIALHVTAPLMALCFLETPIDFQAMDGKPVHTLFTIVSPTIKTHLALLSRLSFGLRVPAFAAVVAGIGSSEEILREAGRIDESLDVHPPSRKGQPT